MLRYNRIRRENLLLGALVYSLYIKDLNSSRRSNIIVRYLPSLRKPTKLLQILNAIKIKRILADNAIITLIAKYDIPNDEVSLAIIKERE